jgi:type IV pilus assembly protein PilE
MRFDRYNQGITLVELLVVVLIIGILAGVAIPVYTQYMVRARRSDAKTVLEQVRAAQEMWRAERGTYAINDANGTAMAKLVNTMGVPPSPIGGAAGDYTWAFNPAPTGIAFTAVATPFSARQAADGWLSIDQNGTKTDADGVAAIPPYNYPDPRSKWSK